MSEEVVRQIQGACAGEMQRGEWSEFHINIGKQYPVKLATKKEEIKTLARLAGQSMAVWTFTESQGNPNPHRPGEFFKNRYLSNVEVGGQLNPAYTQPQVQGQTQMANAPAGGGVSGGGMPSPDGRDTSIERQTLVKAAIAVYPASEIKTEDDWFKLLNRLDAWMAHPRVTQATVETVPPLPPPPSTEGPPEYADDDIPF